MVVSGRNFIKFISDKIMNKIHNFSQIRKQQVLGNTQLNSNLFNSNTLPYCWQDVMENLTEGIVMLTAEGKIIYTNEWAGRFLRQINRGRSQTDELPREIWHVCQCLIESRHLFPHQHWRLESKIITETSVFFQILVQWMKLNESDNYCLVVIVKDQYETMRNIALAEAEQYGLTDRETEVWLLHRSNYTYKQIAMELNVTPNTVKKHMKSILAKRKAAQEEVT